MNGFELYKKYTAIGEDAGRDTNEWRYAQTLTEALYIIGVTRLFDMLEKAEEHDMRVAIIYQDIIGISLNLPDTVQLVSSDGAAVCHDRQQPTWTYSYHTL